MYIYDNTCDMYIYNKENVMPILFAIFVIRNFQIKINLFV